MPHHHEDIVQKVHAGNETEEFDGHYRKRPKVEGTLSELLRTRGLRFGRYLGQERTEMQALLSRSRREANAVRTSAIDSMNPTGRAFRVSGRTRRRTFSSGMVD